MTSFEVVDSVVDIFNNEFHRLKKRPLQALEDYSNFMDSSNFLDTKNRYRGVFPFPEETRVKLSKKNVDDEDYINANYVNGEVGEDNLRYYIACQAPLESTLEDFWRMIWEQECGVIVMLTPLIETVYYQKGAAFFTRYNSI